jgi:hypothetical protein
LALEELKGILSGRWNGKDTLVWRVGLSDWQRAGDVRELDIAIIKPPPIIPTLSAATAPTAMTVGKGERQRGVKRLLGYGATVLLATIGMGLSQAMGATIWVPTLFVGAAFWILKFAKLPPILALMLGVIIGHCLMFLAGALFLFYQTGEYDANFLGSIFEIAVQVAVIVGLAAWVITAQSRAAIISVLVYATLGLLENIYVATTEAAQPIMMQIAFRLAEIGTSTYALVKFDGASVEQVSEGRGYIRKFIVSEGRVFWWNCFLITFPIWSAFDVGASDYRYIGGTYQKMPFSTERAIGGFLAGLVFSGIFYGIGLGVTFLVRKITMRPTR